MKELSAAVKFYSLNESGWVYKGRGCVGVGVGGMNNFSGGEKTSDQGCNDLLCDNKRDWKIKST